MLTIPNKSLPFNLYSIFSLILSQLILPPCFVHNKHYFRSYQFGIHSFKSYIFIFVLKIHSHNIIHCSCLVSWTKAFCPGSFLMTCASPADCPKSKSPPSPICERKIPSLSPKSAALLQSSNPKVIRSQCWPAFELIRKAPPRPFFHCF